MAIYSTGSVRQLFVANYSSGTNPGTFVSANTTNAAETAFKIKFINAEGKTVSSDEIPTSTSNTKLKVTNYKAKALTKDTVTIGTPVVGQTYTLRVVFSNWGSGSGENQYIKHVGAYKAKSGDTGATVAAAIKAAADINFAREAVPLLKFTVASNVITVEEIAQPWVLGKQEGRPLRYQIQMVPALSSSGDYVTTWATVARTVVGFAGIGTGHIAADMEYFFLGERGDIYRNLNFPYNFDTQYLVDKSKVYDIIDLEWTPTDKSALGDVNGKKQLTILCQAGTEGSVNNNISSAINIAISAVLN